MDNNSIPQNSENIQVGPPFRCFVCGASVQRIDCYTQYQNPTAIPNARDAWGPHIWYLILADTCRQAGHKPVRVARLGDAITPLVFPGDSDPRPLHWISAAEQIQREQEEIQIIRDALARIAQALGPNPEADPAASIVYRLVAGVLAPDDAVLEIQDLVQRGVTGVLIEQPREHIFEQMEV